MSFFPDSIALAADIATAAGFVVAAFAAVIGYWQFVVNIRENREIAAKQLFSQYEVLCLSHPKFANPSLAAIDFAKGTFDGSVEEFERYQWFVSHVDTVCEEIMFLSKRKDWGATLASQLEYHSAYFNSEYYERSGYFAHVSPPIQRLLKKINPRL
jgi:hypothetical protein